MNECVAKRLFTEFGQRIPQLIFVQLGDHVGLVFLCGTPLDKKFVFPNRILNGDLTFEQRASVNDIEQSGNKIGQERRRVGQYL